MVIEVRLYATLRRFSPDNPGGVLTIDLPDGLALIDLLADLGIDPGEVKVAMVNGISSDFERVLFDGDRVGLFPPVGGG